MDIESLSQTIKKALENYDNKNMKYFEYTNNNNFKIDEITDDITFYFEGTSETFQYEILGYFDNQSHIWIWGWLLGDLESQFTQTARELLEYGLKLEPKSNTFDHFMIKALLVNSRIQIDESVQLDINLAIYSSLMREKIKFIFPRIRYIDESKTKYVTFYYLVK